MLQHSVYARAVKLLVFCLFVLLAVVHDIDRQQSLPRVLADINTEPYTHAKHVNDERYVSALDACHDRDSTSFFRRSPLEELLSHPKTNFKSVQAHPDEQSHGLGVFNVCATQILVGYQ